LKVAAYGAAAKGNTLLNFAGVDAGDIAFVVDRNPAKQGRFMPGSHIPIVGEDRLISDQPDRVVILPWNIETEIRTQLTFISDWGGQFVTRDSEAGDKKLAAKVEVELTEKKTKVPTALTRKSGG
jgi:hypothetical protein